MGAHGERKAGTREENEHEADRFGNISDQSIRSMLGVVLMMSPQKVSTSPNGGSGTLQTSAFKDVKGRH